MTTTPVTLGAVREMWFANLSDAAPQWSFLEDPVGTVKRGAQYGRTQRLDTPINLGPNSTWHQLTWQGGELQDIWSDEQMYQTGDVDVTTYTGKMRMWPGFASWRKNDNASHASRVVMCEGGRSDLVWTHTPLYIGEGDSGTYETRNAHYVFYQLHPGYGPSDSRSVQFLHQSSEPYRFAVSAQSDDYASGVTFVATATHLYSLIDISGGVPYNTFVEDTAAPVTTSAGFEFMWDSAVIYNEALYYCHGNRLYKRTPKPPYSTVGTHTLIKAIKPAKNLRSVAVWNNRLYFGAFYPNGHSAVFVTDGATTTKAFDFPTEFQIAKMYAFAGNLYIIGVKAADPLNVDSTGNVVQQLWRYDGRSLKKLWQEGLTGDGEMHFQSDLCEWEGLLCWGKSGTASSTRANLMFYDPVNDAIFKGPGLDLNAANLGSDNGRHLRITAIHNWHNTLAVLFKDDTIYDHSLKRPTMLAVVRPENQTKDDLRYPHSGSDVAQFAASTASRSEYLTSSEYHGTDDVATEKKTWLSVRMRCKVTTANASIIVSVITTSGTVAIGTVTSAGGTDWQDVILPVKSGTSYIQSRKVQLKFELKNSDTGYSTACNAWVDDVALQWVVSPRPARQWQVRIPCTDAQLKVNGNANSLTTSDTLAQKLEDLYFNAVPIKFWEPVAGGATPSNGSYVECRILDFQRQQALLSTDGTNLVGSVTLTLVENVLT